MTGAAAAAWAAYLGALPVTGTWLAWLASPWAVGIVTVFALVELVTDQLPSTPSRKVPVQFGTRVLIGAVAGAAFGLAGGSALVGLALERRSGGASQRVLDAIGLRRSSRTPSRSLARLSSFWCCDDPHLRRDHNRCGA